MEQAEIGLIPNQQTGARKLLRPLAVFYQQSPVGAVSGVFLVLVILMAIAAPVFAPYHPLTADFTVMTESPDVSHPLGTDPLGRDTLSRIIYGARYTLIVAFAAVLLGTTSGAVQICPSHAVAELTIPATWALPSLGPEPAPTWAGNLT